MSAQFSQKLTLLNPDTQASKVNFPKSTVITWIWSKVNNKNICVISIAASLSLDFKKISTAPYNKLGQLTEDYEPEDCEGSANSKYLR